jgi:hypothetical protein
MPSLKAAALNYAKQGVPVFPCHPGTKTPACPHGFKDATTDAETVAAWWDENPEYNPAFSPHEVGLGVIDLDGPDGETAWAEAQLAHGLAPETWEVKTPRGRHLYFKGEVPPTQGNIGQHIDTRGVGSYALLPPSVIDQRNGKGPETWGDYRRAGGKVAAMPDWILPAIQASRKDRKTAALDELDLPANIDRARTMLRAYVDAGTVAQEGEYGDKTTYVVACDLLGLGLTPETAFDLMSELWNPACDPPWSDDELQTKIENASRYAQNEAGAWAVEPASDVFGGALDKLAPTLTQARQNSKYRPLTEAEQDSLPEPTWLLPDVIPAESTVLWYGPSGSYKSFLALDMAFTLASGVAGWESPEREPMDVVYISGEGARSIARKRRPAWRIARGIDGPMRFHLIPDMPWLGRPEMVAEMVEAIKAAGVTPRLIVLDTLARAMVGMDEQSARDAGLFVEACEFLKRVFGCTVMAVHHTGKDESRGARGSSALLGGFDATYEVKAHKVRKAVEVWNRKQKDAEERAKPWTFEGRDVGGSLVFFGTDGARHQELTGAANVAPRAIARTLIDLKATTPEKAVTTMVLASTLLPPNADETADARQESVDSLARELKSLARTRLSVFVTGRGEGLRWSAISAEPVERPEPEPGA